MLRVDSREIDRWSRALTASAALLTLLVATGGCSRPEPGSETLSDGWSLLEPGLELGVFAATRPSTVGDGRVHALRIDPSRFELKLLNASADGSHARTARDWASDHDLIAAVNASMYQEDYLTSVSMMRTREHVNNPRLTRDRSVLAFDRQDPEVPEVKIIDRDCDEFDQWEPRYGSFVQSIRMLSCKGENVWKPQPRRWSTAAIGTDDTGRVLFVHVRSPFTTHELIDMLTALPLDLQSLMYAEGGPEAQLFIDGGETEYEFVGSFETARNESANNHQAWPIPNVVGITRR